MGEKYAGKVAEYANVTGAEKFLVYKAYDILKLLNHEEDYRRIEY